jgi:putative hydrolase of the HAD superfamily
VIDLFMFDEGGVMIRNFMVLPDMAAALGLPLEELRQLLRPDMHEFSCGLIGSQEFWRRFTQRTGMVVGENYWDTLFHPTPIPESFALVRELAALSKPQVESRSGKGDAPVGSRFPRVVAATNTIDCHHATNQRLGLYEGFHRVYASHELGFSKPDPRFWQAILDAEGVDAERAFFTDDSADNVEVARDLGIEARLFVNAEALRRDLVALGVRLS